MMSFNTDGLAHLLVLGLGAAIFIGGLVMGFGAASIINLGKMCL